MPTRLAALQAERKGIDVQMAIDVLGCALSPGEVETIIVASQDTDLVLAIKAARDFSEVQIEVAT